MERRSASVSGPDALGIGGPLAFDGHVYVALGGETGGGYYGEQANGAAWVYPPAALDEGARPVAFAGVKSWNGLAARPSGFVAIGYDEEAARSGPRPTGFIGPCSRRSGLPRRGRRAARYPTRPTAFLRSARGSASRPRVDLG